MVPRACASVMSAFVALDSSKKNVSSGSAARSPRTSDVDGLLELARIEGQRSAPRRVVRSGRGGVVARRVVDRHRLRARRGELDEERIDRAGELPALALAHVVHDEIGRGRVVVDDRPRGAAVTNDHADRVAERQREGLVAFERRVADDV